MNKALWILALLTAVALGACDRQPTVVTVPATPVVVPGPAGPAGATGATGSQGATGDQGATGKPGSGTTVNVMPAASAPSY